MLRFPLVGFREKRPILSKEELEMRLEEARKNNKSCEVTFFGFREWWNSEPILESVILDKILVRGKREDLEKLAEKEYRKGIKSCLLFDGEYYFLILKKELESLEEYFKYPVPNTCKIVNPLTRIVIPGEINLKTGKRSKIVRRWM